MVVSSERGPWVLFFFLQMPRRLERGGNGGAVPETGASPQPLPPALS